MAATGHPSSLEWMVPVMTSHKQGTAAQVCPLKLRNQPDNVLFYFVFCITASCQLMVSFYMHMGERGSLLNKKNFNLKIKSSPESPVFLIDLSTLPVYLHLRRQVETQTPWDHQSKLSQYMASQFIRYLEGDSHQSFLMSTNRSDAKTTSHIQSAHGHQN